MNAAHRAGLLAVVTLLGGCVSPLPSAPADSPASAQPEDARADAPAADTGAAPAGGATPSAATMAAISAAASHARGRAAPPRPAADAPPPPADLQVEPMDEVIVTAQSLTGFWRLTASHSIDVDMGLFTGIHIRYGGELRDRNICWLQQNGKRLSAVCSSGVVLKSAEGSVDDDKVTMRWWSGPATIIFSGSLTEANHVDGGFSGGVVGLSVTGTVPASLTRLDLPPPSEQTLAVDAARPSAMLLRSIWAELHEGKWVAAHYDGNAAKRVKEGLPPSLAEAVPQSFQYLGQILIRWRKEQREMVQDVYQVQTDKDRDLCRVIGNDAGQVIDLHCLPLPK